MVCTLSSVASLTIRLKCTSATQACVTVFFLVGQLLRVLVPPSQPTGIRTKPAVPARLGVAQRGTALRTHARRLIRYSCSSYTPQVVALALAVRSRPMPVVSISMPKVWFFMGCAPFAVSRFVFRRGFLPAPPGVTHSSLCAAEKATRPKRQVFGGKSALNRQSPRPGEKRFLI